MKNINSRPVSMKIKRIIKALSVLIISLIAYTSLSAETLDNDNNYDAIFLNNEKEKFIIQNGDLPVNEIVIHGIKKTSPSVILSRITIKNGDPLSAFNPYEAVNNLKKTNLFSDITISYNRNGDSVDIIISLKEKWTLIPIPMYSSNKHGTSYGLYLIETNFLGYGKTIFTGGIYSRESKKLIIGYIDQSILNSNFRGAIFLSHKDEIYQKGDSDYNIFSKYKASKTLLRVDAGYSFSDAIKIFAASGFWKTNLDYSYNEGLNVPEEMSNYLTGIIARYENTYHNEYLYFGTKVELTTISYIPMNNNSEYFNVTTYKGEYNHKITPQARLNFFSSGGYGNRPSIFEENIGGKPGARTLPADILCVDDFINWTLSFEQIAFKFKWGVVTVLAFFEGGFYKNDYETSHYYGPGIGTLVYLKNIALPAMGFNIAKNLHSGYNEFSVNIGMSF